MSDNFKDKVARDLLKEMPNGIDIVDDEDHVLNRIIGDPKTNKIKINKSLLGSSGSTTGGGDTPTDDDGHTDVGDDIYPGDVTQGEVTDRWNLYTGDLTTGKINFNQDLGTGLSNLNDGMQLRVGLKETPYLNGKALATEKMNIINKKGVDNNYFTNSPIPISIRTSSLLSNKTLEFPLEGGEPNNMYISTQTELKGMTTPDDTAASTSVKDIGYGYADVVTSQSGHAGCDSYVLNLTVGDKADRHSERLVVLDSDNNIVAKGLQGSKTVVVNGLKPNSKISDGWRVTYQNVKSGVLGKTISLGNSKDNTPEVPATPTSFNSSLKWVSDSYTVTKCPYGFVITVTDSNNTTHWLGYRLAIFDKDNNVVAKSGLGQDTVEWKGLEPNQDYGGYKLGYIIQSDWEETDKKVTPKISVTYNPDDQSMNVVSTKGSVSDSTGKLKVEYEPVIYSVNSFKRQAKVGQLSDSYLFVGKSSDLTLSSIDNNFDNISDGLVIEFETPIKIMPTLRTVLSSMNLSSKLFIKKEDLMSGNNTFDFYPYIFGDSSNIFTLNNLCEAYNSTNNTWSAKSGYSYMGGTKLALNIGNKKISIDSDIRGSETPGPNSTTPTLDFLKPRSQPTEFNIISVKTFTEEEAK